LLCEGNEHVSTASLGSIKRYGGPILYLFISTAIFLVILVWVDSGSQTKGRLHKKTVISPTSAASPPKDDVIAAAESVAISNDLLRVISVSKSFNGNQVVDDVSLGVGKDTVFALLGPNGAGKTTIFNIIRKSRSHFMIYSSNGR
jgi:ABC-type multidrug transport system fused ATPase/permease subunit